MPVIYALAALIAVGIIARILNSYVSGAGGVKPILNVVLALIAVGMGLWLVNTYIPMAGSIKAILNIVVVITTCVGVLQAFGLWGGVVSLWARITSHLIPR